MVDTQQNEIRDILMMQNIFFAAAEMIILIYITVSRLFLTETCLILIHWALHVDEKDFLYFSFCFEQANQLIYFNFLMEFLEHLIYKFMLFCINKIFNFINAFNACFSF